VIANPSRQPPSDEDPKARELAGLPVGIRVTHAPNPVKAQAGGRSGRRYTWLYETRVAAISEDVSIVEFGTLDKKRSTTVHSTRPSLPSGIRAPGRWCIEILVASTRRTTPAGDALLPFETRWYFIGKTRSGRLVKGEETIRGTPEVDATTIPKPPPAGVRCNSGSGVRQRRRQALEERGHVG
jgi:hypothetical protein